MTLITIPYWWDKKVESVVKTIHISRPDIEMPRSLLNGEAIPVDNPKMEQYKCTYRILNHFSHKQRYIMLRRQFIFHGLQINKHVFYNGTRLLLIVNLDNAS